MDTRSAELLELIGGLVEPERRPEAAAVLARRLGGAELLLFAADPELGVLLPAPGLPQVLRGADRWRAFLAECVRAGRCSGTVCGTDGETVAACGCALPDGTAAVLMDPRPGAVGPEPLRAALPLLGALFRAERRIAADAVRARSAADAVERSRVLTRVLQETRQRLETALVEAEQARAEAEGLATELQEQAMKLELLNDELVERTEEAERARAAADEANRAKSGFLANMSHELRTPINAVIGYAELLDMGITGPITERQQAQLQRIRASSAHLLGLVNDVLDLAKVEAGRMSVANRREPVAEVVAEAAALIEVQAAGRQLQLVNDCQDPTALYVGDRDRVRQILVNLLSNAVKFTQPGGRVTLRCGGAEPMEPPAELGGEGPWVYLAVEDTGIGMDVEQLSRVFQPFVQAEAGHTRTHGGTGLGLTISRRLARLMGGDLTVQSEPGVGSCFTLWLPAVSPEPGALGPEIQAGPSSAGDAYPAGLAAAGAILQMSLPSITAEFTRRLRDELPAATAPMDDSEILSHAAVLIADLAGLLIRLERDGGDPLLLRSGSDVQRLVAEEHGAERGRRGWSASALHKEFEVLREQLIAAVQHAGGRQAEMDVPGITRVIGRLVEAARRSSASSHAAAASAAE